MSVNALAHEGAQPQKPTRFTSIWTARYFTGLWTNRSPLRDGGSSRTEEIYFGPRGDALIDGLNVEQTTRLTLGRRPGLSVYNSQNWVSPNCFYEFRCFNQNDEDIFVMVDQADALYNGTGPATKDSIWTKTAGAGQTYMQSVGNTLYFGNGKDQKKWLQTLLTWLPNTSYSLVPDNLNTFIIDPNGNMQQLINTIFPITNVTVTADGSGVYQVVTITSTADLLNTIQDGDEITPQNLVGASFLNGQILTISNVGTHTATAQYLYTGPYSGADTGTAVVTYGGGTPVSGGTEPTWNMSLLGTTNDGTAQWENRGQQVENWGIAAPLSAPSLKVTGASGAWQANTFYGPAISIIDSNGNLQTITTGGKSGPATPAWATTLGANTQDNSVTWTMTQTAASLVWQPGVAYQPGQYLVETAVGTSCLFQLVPYTGVQLGEEVQAYLWSSPTSGPVGSVTNFYPATPGSPASGNSWVGDAHSSSLLFGGAWGGSHTWAELNGAGEKIGDFTLGPTSNFQTAFCTSLVIPSSGNYTFQINHVDGAFWGFGQGSLSLDIVEVQVYANILTVTFNQNISSSISVGTYLSFSSVANATFLNGLTLPISDVSTNQATFSFAHANYPQASDSGTATAAGSVPTLVSASTNTNPIGQTQTFVNGYNILQAHNVSSESTGSYPMVDNATIYFPSAGIYPLEIDSDFWFHNSPEMSFFVLDGPGGAARNIAPVPAVSTSTAPTWPAFTTSLAPAYASVTEGYSSTDGVYTGGSLTWENLGPVSAYAWTASTGYTTATQIVDTNSNFEKAFEAGISGSTAPTWATTLYALTYDSPNLVWLNNGPASSAPSGTISTFNGGWQYYIALVNTLDNTVSDVGQPSVSTGNFYSGTGVTISGGLPVNVDPQVDYVAIFRTQDGGATYYLIPGTDGNTPYTVPLQQYEASGYVDITPDTSLNEFIQAPTLQQNAVPPEGIINLTYHLSRIFGSVGNTVYWSSGPDTPVGNGVNGFSPSNYAIFPSLVKKLVALATGLLVFTVSDIYLIYGSATSNSPLTPMPYAVGVGLGSYNALDINGGILYFYTTDAQLVSLDPNNGLTEVGFPIGDQLEQAPFYPSTAYVTWHISGSRDKSLFVCDGQGDWFRMNPTPSPETGVTWNPKATIIDGCKAVQSVETSPGVHQLLVGPSAQGPILFRDINNFSDNGKNYEAYATFGSLVLAHPGQIAELGFVTFDSVREGTPLVPSVLIDEIKGVFEPLPRRVPDPPQLQESKTLYSYRHYFAQTGLPAICRHLQLKIQWPAENAANEMLTSTLYGGFLSEG